MSKKPNPARKARRKARKAKPRTWTGWVCVESMAPGKTRCLYEKKPTERHRFPDPDHEFIRVRITEIVR